MNITLFTYTFYKDYIYSLILLTENCFYKIRICCICLARFGDDFQNQKEHIEFSAQNGFRYALNSSIYLLNLIFVYSVRSAVTGSFLAAIFAGTNPAMNVKSILITISITAPATGRTATLDICASE